MRSTLGHPAFGSAAILALATAVSGCSGGGATTSALPAQAAGAPAAVSLAPPATARAASNFGLGLVAADARTIAKLTLIRHAEAVTALPAAVDLSPKMPPVGNQGQEGSCVSWASAYALRGYEARQDVWSTIAPKTSDPNLNFSPAFVYNQVNGGRDGGSTIPSALTLLQQKGAATMADMPYIAGQFTTKPSAGAFADALRYKLSSFGYIAPTDLRSMKVQLAAGIPVVLAIKVYQNFFSLANNQIYTGIGGSYAGGHAITAVGYDDAKGAIEIINSWGPYWGTSGYGWISYPALNQIALEAYSAIDDHGVPSPTPSSSSTPSPAPKPAVSPTATPKPVATPTAKPSPTATPKPAPSATATASAKR